MTKYSLPKLLAVFIFPAVVLCGCLSSETPCHYFQIYQKIMYNNVWNIDSLHVYVYKENTLYEHDTSYINYGTLKFVSLSPYSCSDTGNLVITTSNNTVINMGYSTGPDENYNYNAYGYQGYYPDNDICIQSNTSLDGYPAPYYLCSFDSILQKSIKIYGDPYNQDSVVRYWEFFLTAR